MSNDLHAAELQSLYERVWAERPRYPWEFAVVGLLFFAVAFVAMGFWL